MSHAISLVGLQLGTFTVVERSLVGRGSNGCLMWRCRCNVCGASRIATGTYLANVRRGAKRLTCQTCRDRVSRCGLCRKHGHATASCPDRRPKRICDLCASLPHRVTGMRCKRCHLRFEPEPAQGIDYGARNPNALVRLMESQ